MIALPPPPVISKESIDQIAAETVQYAKTHGLVMNQRVAPDDYRLVHVPHVLLPTIYSRNTFEHLKRIAPLFSLLVDLMSRDSDFLLGQLAPVLQVDSFTRRIACIYKQVYVDEVKQAPLAQPLAMGVHRSDYMLHGETKALQVELNTISSAFGALSQWTQRMHAYVVRRFGLDARFEELGAQLEPNNSLDEITLLMKEAHDAFLTQRQLGVPNSTGGISSKSVSVFFVIQPLERNFADQKHLEYELFERFGIRAFRVSLKDVQRHARLDEHRNLVYTAPNGEETIISVAYFRAGYNPSDYPTETEWDARLLLEQSSAIKCPTTGYQLVGTKYIQYIMTLPSILERYLSVEEAASIRDVFTGIYSMQNEAMIEKAKENPQNFVGKPQREGGGNLLFGDALLEVLKEMPEEVREGYILMERISPTGQENIFCRGETTQTMPGVSELGTFCLFVGDSSKENLVANRYGGYLLRTKPKHLEDGGVASGVASMDSIALV